MVADAAIGDITCGDSVDRGKVCVVALPWQEGEWDTADADEWVSDDNVREGCLTNVGNDEGVLNGIANINLSIAAVVDSAALDEL